MQAKDPIELFSENNKASFEKVESLNTEQLWDKIHSQLPEHQAKVGNGWQIQIGRNWKWSIAASILILLVAGLFHRLQKQDDLLLSNIYPSLEAKENEYRQIIQVKEIELGLRGGELAIAGAEKKDIAHLLKELAEIDLHYNEMISDLSSYPDKERLVEMVLKHYEQKIKLLERLSKEIQRLNHQNEINDEVFM